MDLEYAKYLIDKTRQDYNLIADRFSRTRDYIPEDLVVLGEYSLPGEKVLDFGCGNGRLFEVLKDKKVDYLGIDNSKELIDLAKERCPEAKFQIVDSLNLNFPSNYFDKIYYLAVFHHIPSKKIRQQVLNEARRVLKPNSFLIITVWNLWQRKTAWQLLLKHTALKLIGRSKLDFKDIFYPWKNSEGKVLAQRYFHLFTKTELKRVAKKANFKIKKIGILPRPGSNDNHIYLIAEK